MDAYKELVERHRAERAARAARKSQATAPAPSASSTANKCAQESQSILDDLREVASKIGVSWDGDLADGPRHTAGLEKNERRKQVTKSRLSDDQKKSYKAIRSACKAYQSDANIGEQCKALMSAIDGCMNSDTDGEKAAKAASFAQSVDTAASALAGEGRFADAIALLRTRPQLPNPNFDGK